MPLRPAIDENQSFAGLVGLLSGLGCILPITQVMAIRARRARNPHRGIAVGTCGNGALGAGVTGTSVWNNWQ
jgi:S-adenosylmethionine uptake transporter